MIANFAIAGLASVAHAASVPTVLDASSVLTALFGLAVAGLTLLVWRRNSLRDTTLVAPWWWSVVALTTLSAVMIATEFADARATWLEPVRFGAAVVIFCPLMSLLGAKRPQDRAWNLIVLSLWVVLALPAAEALFLQRGQAMEIHGARAWFLWALIGLGLVNLLPTRFWLSALLVAGGQILLLTPYLPLMPVWPFAWADVTALVLFVAALGVASVAAPRSAVGFDRVWLDFRDGFGALWGMRVAQRINEVAQMAGWPVVLGWSGFRMADGHRSFHELPPEVRDGLRQAIQNLLRRFVSDEWIASRLSQRLH